MRNVVLSILIGSCVFLFQNCGGGLPDIQQDINSSSRAHGGCAFGSGTVPNHGVISAYSTGSAATAAACTAASEQRTCTDGVLSGSFPFGSCSLFSTSGSTINLTIATNASNYNIASAAGSPSGPVGIVVTVNSGVVVGSSSTSVAGMTTGNLPAGSTIQIVNNGYIVGAGGAGGTGAQTTLSGAPGGAGGPALVLGFPVTIVNNGVIGGGGGGGGGGAGCQRAQSAGGGGGGAGAAGGASGPGGPSTISGVANGLPGAPGSLTTGGAGGGGSNPGPYDCNFGGNGGTLGVAGATGLANSLLSYGGGPGAGGAAGAAVVRNGFSATFSSGGAAPNILGAIQ